ncbi:hypothetical protein DICPUDRAFT_81918 [Dictyostelium purpureum]|uniref:SUEL-type lectin domain-containing protein n=1 Tax=Dictyostelium purpureum TaxID=5786 RepID=F0ZUZ4_DICPU|nr:uncharacterized protein DICPUDRAFT_81918 [Dictyostelium purpureum]EGC32236.1 hypothetical protein DICPUDRAFT_81918 [Dictyostelium purpureum]|eukprot:XP_003291234.1 hypothetical protein DICPUDRAFT_81918 [Dictyostelium purpureum]
MKLLFTLILLVFVVAVKSSSSSSSNPYFVYTQFYQPSDLTCSGEVFSSSYDLSGFCHTITRNEMVCSEDGQHIRSQSYSNYDCSGIPISNTTLPANKCNYGMIQSCVHENEINIPTSNTLSSIFSNNCDWNQPSSLLSINIQNMQTCVTFNQDYSYILTCNQTNFVENYYQESSCSGNNVKTIIEEFPSGCQDSLGLSLNYICN